MKRFFAGYICGIITCALVYLAIYLYGDKEIEPQNVDNQRTEVDRRIDSLGIKEWPLEKQKKYIDSVLEQHRRERLK